MRNPRPCQNHTAALPGQGGPVLSAGKRSRRRAFRCAVLLLLCLTLSACGPSARQTAEERYVVGVVTKSGSSEYWMTVRRGMETAAAELGMELIILSPDSEARDDVQTQMAETLVQRNVDAIAISPIDSFRRPEYFDTAAEKNIPIVSYDTSFTNLDVPYIGIDNFQAGSAMAEYLAADAALRRLTSSLDGLRWKYAAGDRSVGHDIIEGEAEQVRLRKRMQTLRNSAVRMETKTR